MPFKKLARLLLGLSLVSVPLIANAWSSQADSVLTPISVAVTTASNCAWGSDFHRGRPETEPAIVPARLQPSDAGTDRVALIRPRAEAGLYSNPADFPRLARRVAPSGADDLPFC